MILFEEAVAIVKNAAVFVGKETVPLAQALHRVLVEPVYTDVSMPPFHKSAMDGYACRRADLSAPLKIVGEIPAGERPLRTLSPGECMKIMTGAMVPEGADMVLMKEDASALADGTIQANEPGSADNICWKGEDCSEGDLLLNHGILLQPSHLAVMAAAGCALPVVGKLPAVAVISTGNELVEATEKPSLSQIRNSNGPQLVAQLTSLGLQPDYKGIVKDDAEALYSMLYDAIQRNQLVILSGGVSVGDYDFVPEVLHKLGAGIYFHGMKTKPGKHLLFAKCKHCFVFGMPGNPVSSFVQFETLVKPFLLGMMGAGDMDSGWTMPIQEDYKRKKADVKAFVPVKINADGSVFPLEYHGSAHIHAYSMANGIMEMPRGVYELKKGDRVYVRPL